MNQNVRSDSSVTDHANQETCQIHHASLNLYYSFKEQIIEMKNGIKFPLMNSLLC